MVALRQHAAPRRAGQGLRYRFGAILLTVLVAASLLLAACGNQRDEAAFLREVRSGPAPAPTVAPDDEMIAVGDAICERGNLSAVPDGWLTELTLGRPVEANRVTFLLNLEEAANKHLC
jgi:hypothetical protein